MKSITKAIILILFPACTTTPTYNLDAQPGTDEFAQLEMCLIGMDQSDKCQETLKVMLEKSK